MGTHRWKPLRRFTGKNVKHRGHGGLPCETLCPLWLNSWFRAKIIMARPRPPSRLKSTSLAKAHRDRGGSHSDCAGARRARTDGNPFGASRAKTLNIGDTEDYPVKLCVLCG